MYMHSGGGYVHPTGEGSTCTIDILLLIINHLEDMKAVHTMLTLAV